MKTLHIIIMMMMLSAVSAASAATIDCHNCTDCSQKIQNASGGDTVRLTQDITDCPGTCIEFSGADMITFDGGGNVIDGTNNYYGIYLDSYSCNNVVTNCTITEFDDGIYLFTSYYNDIQNITSSNNHDTGITMLYSSDNTIQDCILQENRYDDFYFRPHLLSDCNNALINVTGSGDRPIGYYTHNVTLQDTEFASLYLCDADNAILDNITVEGAMTSNNALRLFFTDNATLQNVTSSDNFGGIFVEHSNSNTITRATCNNSHHYNIFVSHGSGNTISDTISCSSSQCGIYLYHASGNLLQGITANCNPRGIMLDNSDETVIRNSTITHNFLHGIIGDGVGNTIYNNYFSDNTEDVSGIPGIWNITPTPGTNIIGGSLIAGNYWSSYTDIDADGDGLGDEPYDTLCGIDYWPLVHATGWMCGDVDGNAYISANDCIEAYERAVDQNYPLLNEWAADVDGNNYISANDVVEIYAKAVNPDHPLNCI